MESDWDVIRYTVAISNDAQVTYCQ